MHVQKRPGTHFNAYDDFFSIRKHETESLQALVVRIKGTMSKMQNLWPKGFNLKKLDEELVYMAMVHTLPESYANFTLSVLLLGTLRKTALQDTFHVEEMNQHRHAVYPSTNDTNTALTALVAAHTKNLKTCG